MRVLLAQQEGTAERLDILRKITDGICLACGCAIPAHLSLNAASKQRAHDFGCPVGIDLQQAAHLVDLKL